MDDRDLRELQAEIETLKARLAEVEDRPAGRLRRQLTRVGSSARARLALGTAVTLVAAVSYAATISVPYTFTNGTVADAGEVNANFDTLVVESNDQDSRISDVEGDFAGHKADTNPHHAKTTSFTELTDQVSAAQIPAVIARDAEVGPFAVAAILAADGSGSTLDADALDGTDSSGFVGAGQTSSITSAMIVNGTIVQEDIATGGVSTAEILNGSVGTVDLANDAVTAIKIADDAVGDSEIAAGAISLVHMDVELIVDSIYLSAGESEERVLTCPGISRAISGLPVS